MSLNQHQLARPYAKAIFEYALEHKTLHIWSSWLKRLSQLLQHDALKAIIENPSVTREELVSILIALAKELDKSAWMDEIAALLRVLIKNKRLLVVPAIEADFDALRAREEKTLTVQVRAFSELSPAEAAQLTERLSHRFNRQVTLELQIDPTLLGGMVIQAQNVVIDGSIRGQLTKLSADLAM
jgi:F-type H+-transporting ATPase subunit delta